MNSIGKHNHAKTRDKKKSISFSLVREDGFMWARKAESGWNVLEGSERVTLPAGFPAHSSNRNTNSAKRGTETKRGKIKRKGKKETRLLSLHKLGGKEQPTRTYSPNHGVSGHNLLVRHLHQQNGSCSFYADRASAGISTLSVTFSLACQLLQQKVPQFPENFHCYMECLYTDSCKLKSLLSF